MNFIFTFRSLLAPWIRVCIRTITTIADPLWFTGYVYQNHAHRQNKALFLIITVWLS